MGLNYFCLVCLFVVNASSVQRSQEDTESVVIHAADDSKDAARNSRQLLFGPPPYSPAIFIPQLLPQFNSIPNGMPVVSSGACITNKGALGKCVPYRQCYPQFKFPEVGGNWDNWILGMFDTCNYITEQNRQMFGVCCTNSPKPPVESPEELDDAQTSESQVNGTRIFGVQPYFPQISNWPPPLPTHPPDHTIPPLPTHPPSPGYPGLGTTSKPPPMAWPPTSKPPMAWPPTLKPITMSTSKKPVTTQTSKPTTTKAPASSPVTHQCGAKNGYQDQERIVGGHNADVNEWPWIAALFNGGRQFCGGSLIDNIHILSAAHCVAHMSSWDVARLTVRLGDHNIRTNSEVRHVEKRVKRVVRHRGFDSRTLYNDIAILTLDSPVEFNQQIRPLCLPSSSSDYSGSTGTVIGWGSLRESGPQPAVLQEVNIPIWSNRDCKLKYGHAAPGGIVEHMLCAGQANRDSCSGDSGGPLMVNNGKWTQVGIVSWGIGCGKGQYPGVYTRVEKFLPWINKNLK